jgi:hypothetical protein
MTLSDDSGDFEDPVDDGEAIDWPSFDDPV